MNKSIVVVYYPSPDSTYRFRERHRLEPNALSISHRWIFNNALDTMSLPLSLSYSSSPPATAVEQSSGLTRRHSLESNVSASLCGKLASLLFFFLPNRPLIYCNPSRRLFLKSRSNHFSVCKSAFASKEPCNCDAVLSSKNYNVCRNNFCFANVELNAGCSTRCPCTRRKLVMSVLPQNQAGVCLLQARVLLH